MITDKTIAAWHQAVRKAHKQLKTDTQSAAYQPYSPDNKTGRARDLAALTVVDQRLVEHGFTPLALVDNKFVTSYGPIPVRCWVEHHKDSVCFSLVARGVTEKSDNVDVAEYVVKFPADKPVLEEVSFDVARLVLPQQGK